MKVLGLVGSPRKSSNTDLLVEEILKAAIKNGHKTEKVYLYSLNIEACVDCKACKKAASNAHSETTCLSFTQNSKKLIPSFSERRFIGMVLLLK
jgi:multimeric flavodoxin WrbA